MRPVVYLLFCLLLFIFSLTLVEASVIINEIMYNPTSEQGGDSNGEWIELYNPTNQSVDLTDWILEDKGNPNNINLEGILESGSYLIVADNETVFNATYNCS